jgi:hypothetical protein
LKIQIWLSGSIDPEIGGIAQYFAVFGTPTFHLWCFTSIGDFVVILLGTQQVNR